LRFLDLAVASGYAAICLSLVIVMNPVAPRESATYASAQSSLDSAIRAYIEHVGLPFLTTSSSQAICASAAQAGNGTLVIDVVVQGAACAPSSSRPLPFAHSSLTLDLPDRVVVVEAWLARQ